MNERFPGRRREPLTYADIKNREVRENNEPFVTLPQTLQGRYGVIGVYGKLIDMKPYFPYVPVRESVKRKLDEVDRRLKKMDGTLQLVVAYGYRSLEVQKKYFEQQKKKFLEANPFADEETVNEAVHCKVAVPGVAGHPTGGAVDVYIIDRNTGQPLDFGADIFALDSENIPVFSPNINEEAERNRMVLRGAMMREGFAPYDGEWWHFSFGDKEWAAYCDERYAVYEQKAQRAVRASLTRK